MIIKVRLNKSLYEIAKSVGIDKNYISEKLREMADTIIANDITQVTIEVDEKTYEILKLNRVAVSQWINAILAYELSKRKEESDKILRLIKMYFHPRYFDADIGDEIIMKKYKKMILFGDKKNSENLLDAFELKLFSSWVVRDSSVVDVVSIETGIEKDRLMRFIGMMSERMDIIKRFWELYRNMRIDILIQRCAVCNIVKRLKDIDIGKISKEVSETMCPSRYILWTMKEVSIEKIARHAEKIGNQYQANTNSIMVAIYGALDEFEGTAILNKEFLCVVYKKLDELNVYAPLSSILTVISSEGLWESTNIKILKLGKTTLIKKIG